MNIEYWFLILFFLILIAAFVFVRICYVQDKKEIDAEANKNRTVFFLDDIDL